MSQANAVPEPSRDGTSRTGRTPSPAPHGPDDETGPRSSASLSVPSLEWPVLFAPGQVVAGRYLVARFLARGAMGEVYEVQDQVLGGRVALKIIAPELAWDGRMLERFRREIQLARRVTHRNVCRIFDIGHHKASSGRTEVPFLTMEFLEGETLSERLQRAGRLDEAAALPLVRQMASALDEAHRAGVVHRDFKSGNVLLVPDSDGGERVVVTDFGLACGQGPDDSASITASGAGTFVGTPAYMAPEQVAGKPVGPAADLYALGVVLYEMLAGVKPFTGTNPLVVAFQRTVRAPAPPRVHAPGLLQQWEAAILRCLEREPAGRFVSAAELIRALESAPADPAPAAGRPRSGAPWRRPLGLVAALALLVGLTLAPLFHGTQPLVPGPDTEVRTPRRAVALLGFKNLAGRPEAAWLSTALAEMLRAELGAGEGLRIVPGENVARARVELELAEMDSYSKDTLERLRSNLGTDLVVVGSYFAAGPVGKGPLRLDARVQEAASGETLAELRETGREEELLDLVSRMGAALRRKLGVEADDGPKPGAARASQPGSPEAARLYAEGLAKLRLFDALGARELLEKAVVADPRFPLAHAALAETWAALGYDARAAETAKQAFELSGDLPREERLAVEARYRTIAREWDRAIELYQSLVNFFPDDLEYRLGLAGAQGSAGRSGNALSTIEAIRTLSPLPAEDARIDIAEAEAASRLGDFRRARAVAAQAVIRGEQQGARLLVARARIWEWWALRNLGEFDSAREAALQAKQIYTLAGDRGGVAEALNALATSFRDQGDHAGAYPLDEESLAVFRERGDQRKMTWALNNLGRSLRIRGDLSGASAMYAQALAISREIGDKDGLSRALINTGNVLAQSGQLNQAQQMYEESLSIRREVGDERGVAHALDELGVVLLSKGQLAAARRYCEEALAINQRIGSKMGIAYNLNDLGRIALAEGNLASAREKLEAALAMRSDAGERLKMADSLLPLAELALEEARPADAENFGGRAAQLFAEEGAADWEALAVRVVALSLVSAGRPTQAVKMMERAWSLVQKSQSHPARLTVAVAMLYLRGHSGRALNNREALSGLEQALEEALGLGLAELELSARLALGRIELEAGQLQAGRARLETLELEARARGFGLIARKAAAALRGTGR